MSELKKHIYDEKNGLYYTLVGDYYLPDIQLDNEECRSIGRWGRDGAAKGRKPDAVGRHDEQYPQSCGRNCTERNDL